MEIWRDRGCTSRTRGIQDIVPASSNYGVAQTLPISLLGVLFMAVLANSWSQEASRVRITRRQCAERFLD